MSIEFIHSKVEISNNSLRIVMKRPVPYIQKIVKSDEKSLNIQKIKKFFLFEFFSKINKTS